MNGQNRQRGRQMFSFIGFANYFRQFIRDFAMIAAPLHELVHCKKLGDRWTDLHQGCFGAIKQALANSPTLKMPDFHSPFEVIVDASNVAIGAVLSATRSAIGLRKQEAYGYTEAVDHHGTRTCGQRYMS
jgi:hypothetical protein